MGRNSAGVKAGTNDGGGQYKGKISRVGSLVEMKDKAMYKATKEAISRYHAVMGVRQMNVKLADLGGSAYGVHVTRVANLKLCILTESILTRERRMFQESTPRITRADGVRAQISLLPIR